MGRAVTFDDIEPGTQVGTLIHTKGFLFDNFVLIYGNRTGIVSPPAALMTDLKLSSLFSDDTTLFDLVSLDMTAVDTDVSVTMQGITYSSESIFHRVVLLANTVTHVVSTKLINLEQVDITTDGGMFVMDNVALSRRGYASV